MLFECHYTLIPRHVCSSTSMHRLDSKISHFSICSQRTVGPICALAEMVKKNLLLHSQGAAWRCNFSSHRLIKKNAHGTRHKNMGQLPPGVKWIWPGWCRISHMYVECELRVYMHSLVCSWFLFVVVSQSYTGNDHIQFHDKKLSYIWQRRVINKFYPLLITLRSHSFAACCL